MGLAKHKFFLLTQNLRLLLLEEKYLELLESNHDLEALHCLRQEIAGLPLHDHEKKQKIHHLAGCVWLYWKALLGNVVFAILVFTMCCVDFRLG